MTTDDETLAALDARGRAAAAGVGAALAERPVPVFDPDVHRIPVDGVPPRSVARRWAPVVGVAAAVALVLGTVAVLSSGGNEDSAPVDRVDSGAPVRRFVATGLPEGTEVALALDIDPFDEASPAAAPHAYGPPGELPVVAAAVVGAGEVDGVVELEPGRFGSRSGADLPAEVLGLEGVVVAVGEHQVLLVGPRAPRDALEEMAATVELDGGAIDVDSPSLPAGWEHRGPTGRIFGLMGPIAGGRHLGTGGDAGPSRTRAGSWVGYSDPGVEWGASLSVTTLAATDLGADAAAVFSRQVEEVEVRGRPGLLVTLPQWDAVPVPGPSLALVWVERPGEVIQVAAVGRDRDVLLAVAEGLVVVDEAGWGDLQREMLLNQEGRDEGDEGTPVAAAEGEFSDGSVWVLAVRRRGPGPHEVTADLLTTAGLGRGDWSQSPSTVGPGDPPALPAGVRVGGADTVAWASGLAGEGVATVEVLDAGGASLGRTSVVEGAGVRAWVVELPTAAVQGFGDGRVLPGGGLPGGPQVPPPVPGASPVLVVVARGADGSELDRLELHA